jgi:hypothetical protein
MKNKLFNETLSILDNKRRPGYSFKSTDAGAVLAFEIIRMLIDIKEDIK